MINANANILGAIQEKGEPRVLGPVQQDLDIWFVTFDTGSYPGSGSSWYNKVNNSFGTLLPSISFDSGDKLLHFSGSSINEFTYDVNQAPNIPSSSFTFIQSIIPQNTTDDCSLWGRTNGNITNVSSSFLTTIDSDSNQFAFIANSGSGQAQQYSVPTSSITPENNRLNTFAWTYDGTDLKFYYMSEDYVYSTIDPFPPYYTTQSIYPNINANRFPAVDYRFGNDNSVTTANFSGSLKAILQYDRALSPEEVKNTMYYVLEG
jgi:hypothetical protein